MEATLEPRLVMKGEEGIPHVAGDFFVASYQRGYRWGRHEVRQLLDDIRANAKDAEAERTTPPDYFLQPVVVLRRDDNAWELVDGQQRLTTLFLIAKYISTKLQDARVEYSLTYETRDRQGYSSSEYLRSVGTSEADVHRSDNIDFHHIAEAYDAVVEWFEEPGHGTSLQGAIDMHTALTKWVYVIWYEAPKGASPNDLFIRLNRDRIPLTDAELIKALVLSNSGGVAGKPGRREEIAAQWDRFEKDLRDDQFWAFLTGSTASRPTRIDFLFETMIPPAGHGKPPRYWTFEKVRDQIQAHGAAAFWQDVVARHGQLTGWYEDRHLYHRIGYLVRIGDSIADMIEASRQMTHTAFSDLLVERTRRRLNLSTDDISLLRYGKNDAKCTNLLLLMNVETVLASTDEGSRFSFHAYARDGWSLEHIHAQNAQGLTKEHQRRDWLEAHRKKIETTEWGDEREEMVATVLKKIAAHEALPSGRTDDAGFRSILDTVFDLFGASSEGLAEEDLHGLGNLALLQREFNSKLNNAVFALKRERIVELDREGAYILPCTRDVFLKYYTLAEDQQLSLWGPQDQKAYYEALIAKISPFLLDVPVPDEVES